jgi:hypothetical protein
MRPQHGISTRLLFGQHHSHSQHRGLMRRAVHAGHGGGLGLRASQCHVSASTSGEGGAALACTAAASLVHRRQTSAATGQVLQLSRGTGVCSIMQQGGAGVQLGTAVQWEGSPLCIQLLTMHLTPPNRDSYLSAF